MFFVKSDNEKHFKNIQKGLIREEYEMNSISVFPLYLIDIIDKNGNKERLPEYVNEKHIFLTKKECLIFLYKILNRKKEKIDNDILQLFRTI